MNSLTRSLHLILACTYIGSAAMISSVHRMYTLLYSLNKNSEERCLDIKKQKKKISFEHLHCFPSPSRSRPAFTMISSECADLADTNADGVSSDGAGVLMDRMFSVYICIPGWLYLLLTAPNELTLHAAAPPSLAWIAASVENLRGHALNRYSSVAEHTVHVSVPPPHGRHRGCESQNI